jgi:hypothetical protein
MKVDRYELNMYHTKKMLPNISMFGNNVYSERFYVTPVFPQDTYSMTYTGMSLYDDKLQQAMFKDLVRRLAYRTNNRTLYKSPHELRWYTEETARKIVGVIRQKRNVLANHNRDVTIGVEIDRQGRLFRVTAETPPMYSFKHVWQLYRRNTPTVFETRHGDVYTIFRHHQKGGWDITFYHRLVKNTLNKTTICGYLSINPGFYPMTYYAPTSVKAMRLIEKRIGDDVWGLNVSRRGVH